MSTNKERETNDVGCNIKEKRTFNHWEITHCKKKETSSKYEICLPHRIPANETIEQIEKPPQTTASQDCATRLIKSEKVIQLHLSTALSENSDRGTVTKKTEIC